MTSPQNSNWFPKMLELSQARIPYLHQGHSRNGCDCVGLMRLMLEELGMDYSEFDVPDRPFNPPARAMIRGLNAAFGSMVNGWDNHRIVVFRSWAAGPQHLAICGVDHRGTQVLLHADRQFGRVDLLNWHPNAGHSIYGFWQVPEGKAPQEML
jgi:hypothetical protein